MWQTYSHLLFWTLFILHRKLPCLTPLHSYSLPRRYLAIFDIPALSHGLTWPSLAWGKCPGSICHDNCSMLSDLLILPGGIHEWPNCFASSWPCLLELYETMPEISTLLFLVSTMSTGIIAETTGILVAFRCTGLWGLGCKSTIFSFCPALEEAPRMVSSQICLNLVITEK